MNCEQVQESISGFIDNDVPGIMAQAIGNHIKNCEHCALILEQEEHLLKQLSSESVVEPSEGFFKQALNNAANYHQLEHDKYKGFQYYSAVACFALGVCLTLLFTENNLNVFSGSGTETGTIELTLVDTQQLNINLQVSVSNDIDNAVMEINVPPDLQIVGYEGMSTLEWQVELKKGKNILALPVVASGRVDRNQVSHLLARVNTGQQQKDFDIKVIIKPAQTKALLLPIVNESVFVTGLTTRSIYSLHQQYLSV